ncbi:MAG: M48 family metalloprotease [Candidatus Puniceispirillaceae bacterium]
MKRFYIFYHFFAALIFLIAAGSASKAGLIRDTELERGLEELAWPLAKEAGLTSLYIRIVPNDSYNAFVVGGNTVYVHTGLLTKARSASEILGVFAHEIGHLAAGHAPRRSEAVKDANLTTTLATLAAAAVAASGASGEAAFGVALGGMDRANRNYLALSRHDEAVADEWALRLLESQDISASGLSDFMRRIAGERALPETRQSDYYLTHPGAGARLLVFEDHIREHGHDSPGITQTDDALITRLIGKIRAFTEQPAQTIGDIRRAAAAKDKKAIPQKWPNFDEDDNLYRAAIAHYRRGALNKAEEIMTDLRNHHPNDAYYAEFAGDIFLSNGKIDDAIKAYENALALGPAPLIEFGLGRAYLAKADRGESLYYQQAANAFERAVKTEAKWPELYRQLAISLGRNGQLAKADLALANEALLLGDKERAKQMAKRAIGHETISKQTRNYANDILFSLQ